MKALLVFLWEGCWHRWVIHHEGPYEERERGEVIIKTRFYDLRCEKCGIMKTRIQQP